MASRLTTKVDASCAPDSARRDAKQLKMKKFAYFVKKYPKETKVLLPKITY
jgi:hypothetical protein